MVHSEANVSIDTQPEEERMQGDPIIEQMTNSKLNCKGIYDFQIKGSKANVLIKNE